jgi:RNA polymerase sigma factor (sigma-70 family)
MESLWALADEELVALARTAGGQKALDLLMLRHLEGLERDIAQLAHIGHLAHEDCLDAQQMALFLLREAVSCYDPAKLRGGLEQPFHAFLLRVVRRRVADFTRRLRRDRKCFGHSLEEVQFDDSQAYHVPDLLGEEQPSSRVGQDPSRIAQANEQRERLAAALEKLSPRQQRIGQILWEGGSRREIAKEFGVGYAKAKRWAEEVIARLRAAVKDKYD